MRLKTCLFVLAALISLSLHAQDKIYKKDGEVISSKVKTVGGSTIIYKRFDNQDGPEYTILKKDVSKIVYQNGTTDNFEGENPRGGGLGMKGKHEKNASKYGKNIFTIIPGAYTVSLDGSINDVGVGICYERLLDDRGHFGLNLPVMVSFSSNRDYNSVVNYNGTPNNNNYGSYTSFYFMPGFKFYPATSREKVRYSLGASFFTIFGNEPYAVYNESNYNPTTGLQQTGNWNYLMYGLMISNSVNISATRHLFLSLDLGAGIPLSDNRYADNTGFDGALNIGPWMQIACKVGYRY